MAFAVINSILHIIESIISQEELPDFYEDNLAKITGCCKFILSVEYQKLQKVPDELHKARGKVVSLIYLYNFKFGEHFQQYQDDMFMSIWATIESNKVQAIKSCEKLFRATVKYIGEMTNVNSKKEFIKNNLMKIFDILILPNIAITQED